MLKEDIVEAVKQGQFHIYPVTTIDEGIELLTGVKGGIQLDDGSFEEGSVSQRVNQRLEDMAIAMRDFTRGELMNEKDKKEEKKEGQ